MELTIKNMVCDRCILVLKDTLKQMNISHKDAKLGKVILTNPISKHKLETLDKRLTTLGLGILKNETSKIIEITKKVIIQAIRSSSFDRKRNWSLILSEKTKVAYPQLSKVFSKSEGITIEQYIIRQKIERAKELISYEQNTLSEIAYQLGYSSVAHLSNQFKKITGYSPSAFKTHLIRHPLDAVV